MYTRYVWMCVCRDCAINNEREYKRTDNGRLTIVSFYIEREGRCRLLVDIDRERQSVC